MELEQRVKNGWAGDTQFSGRMLPHPGWSLGSSVGTDRKEVNKALEDGRGQEDAGAQTGLALMSLEPQDLRKGRQRSELCSGCSYTAPGGTTQKLPLAHLGSGREWCQLGFTQLLFRRPRRSFQELSTERHTDFVQFMLRWAGNGYGWGSKCLRAGFPVI